MSNIHVEPIAHRLHEAVAQLQEHLRTKCAHGRLAVDCYFCELRLDAIAAHDEYEDWIDQTHGITETLRYAADALAAALGAKRLDETCGECMDLGVQLEEAISNHKLYLDERLR